MGDPITYSGGTTFYKTVANGFKVTVNGQDFGVNTGDTISIGNAGASAPYGICVLKFSGGSISSGSIGLATYLPTSTTCFSTNGMYIMGVGSGVALTGSRKHVSADSISGYANYSITLTRGIKFK